MDDLCQRPENMHADSVGDELAQSTQITKELWNLLELVAEQIMRNTTFASDV